MVFRLIGSKCLLMTKINKNVIRIDCDTLATANELIEKQPFEGCELEGGNLLNGIWFEVQIVPVCRETENVSEVPSFWSFRKQVQS